MAIIDTGFFSSIFKIGRIELLFRALKKKRVDMPSTAYDEISNSHFYREVLHMFAFKPESKSGNLILVKEVDVRDAKNYFKNEKINILGNGEIGCFILAKQTNDTVLVDDKEARMFGTSEGIKVTSLPAFFLHCKRKKILSLNDLKDIIDDLREKDYYEFSNEVRQDLLSK